MFRLNKRLIIISVAIFLMALLLSGCYTLIGYPPDAKESMEKKHGERSYRDYEYYESPYIYDGEYYFYDFFPYYGTYYYWYRPWWDHWYYWDDGYYYYTPEKKPESHKRGTDNLRNSTDDDRRGEKKPDSNKNADSKGKQRAPEDDERPIRRYR